MLSICVAFINIINPTCGWNKVLWNSIVIQSLINVRKHKIYVSFFGITAKNLVKIYYSRIHVYRYETIFGIYLCYTLLQMKCEKLLMKITSEDGSVFVLIGASQMMRFLVNLLYLLMCKCNRMISICDILKIK